MLPRPLTKKQKEILDFLESYIGEHRHAPSYAEIADRFRLASRTSVAQYIDALQEKGYLTKDGTARGLLVHRNASQSESSLAYELPLLGLIAAGSPIEAIETRETMSVPTDLVPNGRDAYVLKVTGMSMIEDGIMPGDYLVVERNESPRNGDIVVALLENMFATVKHFYREKDRIRLQPANSTMSPIYARDVTVQGIVKAVIRKFS